LPLLVGFLEAVTMSTNSKWMVLATCSSVLAVSVLVGTAKQRAGATPVSPTPQAQAAGPPSPGGARVPGPSIQFQVPPMPVLPNDGLGETDQALIPGQKWRIRDLSRPKPATVTPGRHAGDPPSDAVVLFDGSDLSHWTVAAMPARGATGATPSPTPAPTTWKIESGYVELTPGAGSLTTKERFKDFQLHIEFAEPAVPLGTSQYRGNSGIMIGGREIQILDNYNNPTYADGYVAAIYNLWPPLANASRPPGEWQTLDIAYMAARYEGEKLVRNAFITVFLNGVLVHDNREAPPNVRGGGPPAAGAAGARGGQPVAAAAGARGQATPPGADQPITLSNHPSAIPGNAVRYRNIWIRRLEVELPQSATGGQ
jgi:hypothetical protein